MKRVLPYCVFLADDRVELPQFGVDGQRVNVLRNGDLRVLWSEVDWPYQPHAMQRHAVEFHDVVRQVFLRVAVVPFRLLSVFEGEQPLQEFIAARSDDFVADLKRLRDVVQMECVIYFIAERRAAAASGTAYLQEKVALLQRIRKSAQQVQTELAQVARSVSMREVRSGIRIFVLVDRGREQDFKTAVDAVPIPEGLSRRTSGPWPAAEFLSDGLKSPQPAQVK